MYHIAVRQNTIIEPNVNSSCVEKIYNLSQKQKKLLNYYDNTTNFIGAIKTNYTYEKYIEELSNIFSSLQIFYNDLYITFEDHNAEKAMVDRFGDANGGVTIASVQSNCRTDFGNIFSKHSMVNAYGNNDGDWEIRSFNELSKFPQITVLNTGWPFSDQNLLQSIDLSNITYVGYNAFLRCTSLVNLGNTSNITTIGQYAFNLCSSLISFNLSPLINNLDEGVFQFCSSLTSIDTSHVKTLGKFVFKGCTSLETIDLSNCTSINENAFDGCSSLKTVIGSNITSIRGAAFNGCTSLETIDLSNCTSIESWAFNNTSKLMNVTLSSDITSLGLNCFKNSGINGVINIPNAVLIDIGAFDNTKITKIITGSALTILNQNACSSCSELLEIDLSASINLTTIPAAAFSNAIATKVYIPSSVTSINDWAFVPKDNTVAANRTYYIYATTPPTLSNKNCITNNNGIIPFAIYVPAESVNTYKTANIWSIFADVIQAIPTN